MRILFWISFTVLAFSACGPKKEMNRKLPFLGRFEVVKNESTGAVDTLYHKIDDFRFVNQDSTWITAETFADKIYVADFFFTTCPDICPKMKTQMLRVYDSMKLTDEVLFLSHTVDPKHDSVAVLKDFAERLSVESNRWHFVTGAKEDIYKHGQTSYMASVMEDGSGGLIHSGRFFLIDKERHVRGAYDGTDPASVDVLIKDIKKLMKTYEK